MRDPGNEVAFSKTPTNYSLNDLPFVTFLKLIYSLVVALSCWMMLNNASNQNGANKSRPHFCLLIEMCHKALFWGLGPVSRKPPESFRARKAIIGSSVSKNGELYTPETSCMKGTSLYL